MNITLNGRRDLVLKSLKENQFEIADLNAEIEAKIASHMDEIKRLRLEQKELQRTKIKCGWLLSLLIRWLQ